MKTANKNDLAVAHQSKQLIDPAIQDLKKINVQALGFDPYSLEKVSAFIAWLEKFASKADATIARGRVQYENRPQPLITAALLRMSIIPALIEGEQRTIERQIETRKAKIYELQKQGFDSEEIARILQDPQSENESHSANITALVNEKKNLEDFLASGPAYNTDSLDMEKLKPFLQNCRIAE
jgi:hypothetical protein